MINNKFLRCLFPFFSMMSAIITISEKIEAISNVATAVSSIFEKLRDMFVEMNKYNVFARISLIC